MHRFHLLLAFAFATINCSAQKPAFNACDVVPEIDSPFGYGTNMGYYPPYYADKELAALAHGLPDGSQPGVGVTTIRPGLFEFFLDQWGYNTRKDAFEYYDSIGLKDVVAFIGFPAARHRDSSFFCPGQMSEAFSNLYEPIWDNGENGTPVNDNNPYALYVWKTATIYGPHIKYWEVWNEPDADTGNGWAPPGTSGNWWENAPTPCETKLKAPVFYYIRLLRISYEVIKSLDPDDLVCVGGLGWPSYLDVLCRYTDNPIDGSVNELYPTTGGAYFDVMSFHTYPHLDNSLREWDNSKNDFRYFRHSDAALDGVWRLRDKFAAVLKKHGFNEIKYPAKRWLITEVNLPRKAFGDYIGSDMAQTNFIMKTLISAQTQNVDQVHIYCLADEKPERHADNEFSFMGLFKNLENVKPGRAEANTVATGYKTTSDLLRGATYHRHQTERMKLPDGVRGAAFRNELGQFTYVLWAETQTDQSEEAAVSYEFPFEMGIQHLEQKFWHYSETGVHLLTSSRQVKLDGSPVFLTETLVGSDYPKQPRVYPNPLPGGLGVYSFWMFDDGSASIEVFDKQGQKRQTLALKEGFVRGPHQILLDLSELPAGAYFVRLQTLEHSLTVPVVKI